MPANWQKTGSSKSGRCYRRGRSSGVAEYGLTIPQLLNSSSSSLSGSLEVTESVSPSDGGIAVPIRQLPIFCSFSRCLPLPERPIDSGLESKVRVLAFALHRTESIGHLRCCFLHSFVQRLHLPASLDSTGITPLLRYYGGSVTSRVQFFGPSTPDHERCFLSRFVILIHIAPTSDHSISNHPTHSCRSAHCPCQG
jgi:hypothetical protein